VLLACFVVTQASSEGWSEGGSSEVVLLDEAPEVEELSGAQLKELERRATSQDEIASETHRLLEKALRGDDGRELGEDVSKVASKSKLNPSGNVKPNGNPQDKMLPTPNRVANGGVPDRHMKSVKRTLIDLVNAKIGPFPHKGSKLARGSGSGAMLKKDMFRERLIRKEKPKVEARLKTAKKMRFMRQEIKSKATLKARAKLARETSAMKQEVRNEIGKKLNLTRKQIKAKIDKRLKEQKVVPGTSKAKLLTLKYNTQFKQQRVTPGVIKKANIALYKRIEEKLLPDVRDSIIPQVKAKEQKILAGRIKAEVRMNVDKRIAELRKAEKAKSAAKERGRKAAKKTKAELNRKGKNTSQEVHIIDKEIYKHIASDPSQAAKKIAPKIQKYLEQVAQASLLMGKGDLSAAGKSAAAQAKLDAEIQLAVAKIGKAKADSVRQLMMKIKSLTKSRTAGGELANQAKGLAAKEVDPFKKLKKPKTL
jgi:hypothetical protein